MKMRKSIYIIVILATTLVLHSCKSSSSSSDKSGKYVRKPITEVQMSDLQADALAIDAKTYIETGNYDKALEIYNELLREHPNYAVAYYEISSILRD